MLVQDPDSEIEARDGWDVVTGETTEPGWGDLLFAWRVCKHVSSNAIVLAKDLQTIGIGGGQTSRVDSVKIALMKAAEYGHDPAGRLETRRRGGRSGARGGRDHGAHGPAALPALTRLRSRAVSRWSC